MILKILRTNVCRSLGWKSMLSNQISRRAWDAENVCWKNTLRGCNDAWSISREKNSWRCRGETDHKWTSVEIVSTYLFLLFSCFIDIFWDEKCGSFHVAISETNVRNHLYYLNPTIWGWKIGPEKSSKLLILTSLSRFICTVANLTIFPSLVCLFSAFKIENALVIQRIPQFWFYWEQSLHFLQRSFRSFWLLVGLCLWTKQAYHGFDLWENVIDISSIYASLMIHASMTSGSQIFLEEILSSEVKEKIRENKRKSLDILYKLYIFVF